MLTWPEDHIWLLATLGLPRHKNGSALPRQGNSSALPGWRDGSVLPRRRDFVFSEHSIWQAKVENDPNLFDICMNINVMTISPLIRHNYPKSSIPSVVPITIDHDLNLFPTVLKKQVQHLYSVP